MAGLHRDRRLEILQPGLVKCAHVQQAVVSGLDERISVLRDTRCLEEGMKEGTQVGLGLGHRRRHHSSWAGYTAIQTQSKLYTKCM